MTVRRKDFQKTSAYIHQFLIKLDYAAECAEVRDSLNLALLHMQKYYRFLRRRLENKDKDKDNASLSNTSLRGLSPMTPPVDLQDKFQWRWQDLDGRRMSLLRSQEPGLPLGIPLALTASKTGDMETLTALLMKNPACLEESDGYGRSLLMYSVQYDQYETADWLLRSGANVNAQAHDQSTALHLATYKGQWNFTELLIKYKANVDWQDNLGRAPLHWAVTTPTTECLKILLKHGANPSIRDNDYATPSMWACRLDNIDHFSILSRLLRVDEFADGMERDVNGRTFLHWSVRRQEPLECLKTLITDENAVVTDLMGKNVLLVASEQGSLSACKIIMEVCGKSIIDYRDQDSRSAVHLATIGGHGEVLNFLLDQGADMELRDCDNATPWDYAKQRQLNYCKLILASHFRQRSKDLEMASQNSLQDQMRASAISMEMQPRPPTTPPNGSRSRSPGSMRRKLRGVVSTSGSFVAEDAAANDNNGADAAAFERRVPVDRFEPPTSANQEQWQQRQQLQPESRERVLESYRSTVSQDYPIADNVEHLPRPAAAQGGRRPEPSESPQPPTQPHQQRRSQGAATSASTPGRLMRSQPPHKLQRQAGNGSLDIAAGTAVSASSAEAQPLPLPQPPLPSPFQSDTARAGSSGHPPRTPPDKQRTVGPPLQLMPLSIPRPLPSGELAPPPQLPPSVQPAPIASAQRKKKKAKARRGVSGSGSSGGGGVSVSPGNGSRLSSAEALQPQPQPQNGLASSPTAPLPPPGGYVQPLGQPQYVPSGGWQGYQRPADLPPPITPRSGSGGVGAGVAVFIPPPMGFGNASAENSPRNASPQPAGSARVDSAGAVPAPVHLPTAGRARAPRSFAPSSGNRRGPETRQQQQKQK